MSQVRAPTSLYPKLFIFNSLPYTGPYRSLSLSISPPQTQMAHEDE